MNDSEMILDVEETRTETHIRWLVHFRGFTAVDVTRPRPAAHEEVDGREVTQALAARFGVAETAVTYRNKAQRPPVRFLPQQAVVRLPDVTLGRGQQ